MAGLWCVTCQQPVLAGEKVMRVGGNSASQYIHMKCPAVAVHPKSKEVHMATPVKPSPKPAAKPAAKPAVKPAAPAPKAAAPVKPAAPAPKAAAPVKPTAPVAKPTPAPEPVQEAQTEASAEAKPKRERKPNPGFADINVQDYAANTIQVLTRNEDGTIRNPKRAGSAPHGRFAQYVDGMTVAQALEAGVTEADIRWDYAHEFIAIQ